ncbi:hypothetical protein G6F40_017635 [Rhizopus arrhizus]|nr:hypothetical protein G6F40_017635 [Rhizopus arrhizus]
MEHSCRGAGRCCTADRDHGNRGARGDGRCRRALQRCGFRESDLAVRRHDAAVPGLGPQHALAAYRDGGEAVGGCADGGCYLGIRDTQQLDAAADPGAGFPLGPA